MPGGREPDFWSLAWSHRANIDSPPASRTARRTVFFDVDHPVVCTCELRRAGHGSCGERTTPTVTPPHHEESGACEDEFHARAHASHLPEAVVIYLSTAECSARVPATVRARGGSLQLSCREARGSNFSPTCAREGARKTGQTRPGGGRGGRSAPRRAAHPRTDLVSLGTSRLRTT